MNDPCKRANSSESPRARGLLEGLNDRQLQAVRFGAGSALVLAGPGSGKTTVIVKRILYLIHERNIPPESILVVTFTKDAALSMSRRFMSLCEGTHPVVFGTFHSVFYHILTKASPQALSILSSGQKSRILTKILKNLTVADTGDTENLLDAISYYKNTLDKDGAVRRIGVKFQPFFEEIFEKYRAECKKQNLIDFDDMLYLCHELLRENRACREYWQKRFRYIMVDEFQDINPMQYRVLKMLGEVHQNLFAVGDEDQSIYGFRGSAPACMQQFEEEFGAKRIILNANYRSSAEIVRCAEQIISENRERVPKESFAAGKYAGRSDSIRFRCFESKTKQTEYLTERLRDIQMRRDGSTIAVLFRTNSKMQLAAIALGRANIDFSMREKGISPCEHFIYQDLSAYLRLAYGSGTQEDFWRIMNKPNRFLSREAVWMDGKFDLEKLKERMERKGGYEGGHGERDRRNREKMLAEIRKLKLQLKQMRQMPLFLAIRFLLKAVGYEAYLRKRDDEKKHREEWADLLEFYQEDIRECDSVYDWERRMEERVTDKNDRVRPNRDGAQIHLMTVHASKGLEFDTVILPDCNESVFPLGKIPDPETVEEERRIFYVAVTRAKTGLELYCITGTKENPRPLSRFLNPIRKILTPPVPRP